MKRFTVWSAITFSAALCIPAALARKPKTIVQFYGEAFENPTPGMWFITAFLILPDGSHAQALCLQGRGSPCTIEPFAAEKRVKVPCDLLKSDPSGRRSGGVICYQSENYYAERKGNDITLSTGKGKGTYHIDGSW
jgi:hypothetical protein